MGFCGSMKMESKKGKNFSKNRIRSERNPGDFYQTPPPLTRLFLQEYKAIDQKDTILEPACGKMAIFNVLEEMDFQNVSAYDLETGIDFFDEQKQFDWIITNPSFSKTFEWILKCKEVARRGFALLLPLTYLHGQARYEKIYKDLTYPLKHVFIFTRYTQLGAEIREDGKIETGMQIYAWFVWKAFHQSMVDFDPKIHWLDNNEFVLRKEKKNAHELHQES